MLLKIIGNTVCQKKKTLSDIEEDYRFNRPYIEPVTIDKTNMEKCKGVILADNGKIGILYDDEEEWIENLHVVRTNFYAEVEIVKIPELRPNPDVISVAMTDAYIPIVSILKVEADGKVDPEVIYYLSRPIQKSPDKAASFDWIEEYYKENGLAPGCTYYKQEKIYESNRNLGPIPLSILKPFSPIH